MKTRTIYWTALLVLQLLALVDAQGSYGFSANSRIVIDNASAESVSATASAFAADLLALTGFTVPVVVATVPQPGDIALALGANDRDPTLDAQESRIATLFADRSMR